MINFYCKKCLMPNTKPYIFFDSKGLCNACLVHEKKNKILDGINWNKRHEEFEKIIYWAKKQKAKYYDALVPVSGGKDSITQVSYLIKHKLRVLAVNIDYGIKTPIGRYNLELIPKMGANLIIFRPNMLIHKKLIRIGLEKYGDPDLMSHTLLHAYPLHVALNFNIPLTLLGENSAFEYGGESKLANLSQINRNWFNKFAANKGITSQYLSNKYKIEKKDLWQYDYPDQLDKTRKTKAFFCSYFFHWSSEKNLKIAKKFGFKQLSSARGGTYRKFVGIDEKINRIHQFQKVLKFGYGRATDHACEDIRNKKISRTKAINLVKKYDIQELERDFISDTAKFLGYNYRELKKIIYSVRNKKIWKKNKQNQWYIKNHLKL